jgi:thioredoxin reductase
MAEAGLVEICYESSIKEIDTDKIIIDKQGTKMELKNDFIFVFAGNIKPYKMLTLCMLKIGQHSMIMGKFCVQMNDGCLQRLT